MRIVTEGHPSLARVCRPFDFRDPPMPARVLELDMVRQMVAANGIGLAAPQVDIDLNVFVMRCSSMPIGVFNPEILEHGGDRTYGEEGCLSFPGLKTQVLRWMRIDVSFQNTLGERLQVTMRDMNARVFQHEMDHLVGRTIRQSGNSVAAAMVRKNHRA